MKVCWKTRCLMGTKGCWWPREVSAGCWNAKWKPNSHYFTALIGWVVKCTGLKVRQQIVLPAIITWGSVVLVLFSSSVREPRTCTLKSHWRNDRITWGAAFRESWKIHKKRKQTKDYSSEMEQWNKKAIPAEWIIGGQRDGWMVSAKGPCVQWDWEKPNREETGSTFPGRRQAWERRGSHMYVRVETPKRKRPEVSCFASWIQWIQILTVIVSVGKRMKNQLNTGEKASI